MTADTTKYQGRSQTQLANTDGIGALMETAAAEYASSNSGRQIPLSDLNAVKQAAVDYMRECAERGALPSVRGIAARLGCTRQALYQHAKRQPGGGFALWLEDFSDACAEATMAAAMAGNVREVSAIFTAKARYQWREAPQQIEIGQLNPLTDSQTTTEIAARYAELPPE